MSSDDMCESMPKHGLSAVNTGLRRRDFIKWIGGAAAVWPLAERAQQASKLRTIGLLSGATPSAWGPVSDAHAAGPFDGEWNGSATATTGQCKPAIVTLTILGRVVTGRAMFEAGAQDIHGTVWEDGTFGATIGFQHLTGNFIDDTFEGNFAGFGCAWKMSLKTKKPR